MNILFICSKNKWRSKTAEEIYKNGSHHQVISAGTEPSAKVRASAKHIVWADIIFAMEKPHKQRFAENFPEEIKDKKVVVLDIPDEYEYMDRELVDMIRLSVDPYL